MAMPAYASEALTILDPMDLEASVYPADDGYFMTLVLDDTTYWERFLNSVLRFTHTGAEYENQNSQQRLLDNITYMVYPMGYNTAISTDGLSINTTWDSHFTFTFEHNEGLTEDFQIRLCAYLLCYGSDGNMIDLYQGEFFTWTYDPSVDAPIVRHHLRDDFDISANPGSFNEASYVAIRCTVEFSGIDDEEATTNVNFSTASKFEITIPVSDSYGEYIQSGQTNAYLDRIESELELQGQTLDQILNGSDDQQGAADDFNSDMDDMTPDIKDDLEQLEQVTKPNVDNIDTDLESMVGESGVRGTNNILTMLTGYSVVTTQFVIVLTIMLIGYVLYGKRG